MKKFFILALAMMALTATSCNGSGNASDKVGSQAAGQSQEAVNDNAATSSDGDSVQAPIKERGEVAPLSKDQAPGVATNPKPLEQPKVQPKPESEVDKMLKQYNELMVAMILAHNEGKDDKESTQQFLNIKGQLDKLDKSGKLSDTQKELFKVTNDAYNKLQNK